MARFDASNGKQVLRAYAAGQIGRVEALDLLEQIDWTTATNPDGTFPVDNAWHLVDALLDATPDFPAFRAELVARVRHRRGLA